MQETASGQTVAVQTQAFASQVQSGEEVSDDAPQSSAVSQLGRQSSSVTHAFVQTPPTEQ